MKKTIALILAAVLMLSLVGCGSEKGEDPADESNTPGVETPDDSTSEVSGGKINVISREDGSGTRGAFIELFEIEEKDADGNKIDNTTDAAEITNSTSVMMTTVAGDKSAIGYISLGSLNDTVKAVKIDGVSPSVEAIKDGSYTISRPFNIATNGDVSEVAQDFIDFIMSTQGQDVVEGKGYIPMDNTKSYDGSAPSGKVVVAGSSSVTPVMEALAEAYKKVNPDAEIEIQQSDSTTGMNSVIEGICDIGMASREAKDSELEAGIDVTVIAMDGIAVIVNKENSVSDLSKEQVKSIFTGDASDWSKVQ